MFTQFTCPTRAAAAHSTPVRFILRSAEHRSGDRPCATTRIRTSTTRAQPTTARARRSPPGPVTIPLNAITAIAPTLDGLVGDAVDVINNLSQGALLRIVPGVPPGPRTRTYELSALPDAGAGNLAFPALGGVPGAGTIVPVDDTGAAAAAGMATGLSFTGGAYAASLDPVSPTLYIGGGWALSFAYRVPTGAKNSSKFWVSIGKRGASNYGVSVAGIEFGRADRHDRGSKADAGAHPVAFGRTRCDPHGAPRVERRDEAGAVDDRRSAERRGGAAGLGARDRPGVRCNWGPTSRNRPPLPRRARSIAQGSRRARPIRPTAIIRWDRARH